MTRIDLIKTDEARVARIFLDPGESSPAHYHSSVIENVVCLSGKIAIKFGTGSDQKLLTPGQICEIEQHIEHYLMNPSKAKSEYLLVQKGDYDFVPVNS